MKKQSFAVMLACCFLHCAPATPPSAADTKSQLIQIQTQLQLMQDNMSRMQQSFDERMGVMKDLLTQQTDNVNKMGSAVQNLQKTLGQQTSDAGSKVDQISGQVQALHDAVDELKARLAKVSKQLDDMQTAQQNITAPPAGSQPGGIPAARRTMCRKLRPQTSFITMAYAITTPTKTIWLRRSSPSIYRSMEIPILPATRSSTWEKSLIARETTPAPCRLTTKSLTSIPAETRPPPLN